MSDGTPTTGQTSMSASPNGQTGMSALLAAGRWPLLLLLAGHLLLRREFAHRSVGELFGVTSGWLARAYVTEVALLVLLPLAALLAWWRWHGHPARVHGLEAHATRIGFGAAVPIGLAFLAWG